MRMLSMLTLAGATLAISACGPAAIVCKDKANPPGYAAAVEPIIKGADSKTGKCTSCHSIRSKDRKNAPMNSNYDSYEEFKKIAATASERVGTKQMPPSSEPALTAAEIDTIQQWVACGTAP